jgi:hypothetical protein
MSKNGDDVKGLLSGLKETKSIHYYKQAITKYKFGLLIIGILFLFQFVFVGIQCNSSKALKINSKMRYLSTYMVEQKIVMNKRKKEAMQKAMKVILWHQPNMNERLVAQVAEIIYEKGEKVYGIKTEEFLILPTLESSWKRKALSNKGARGPCQIMYLIGEWMADELNIKWEGAQTLYDYKKNIRMGLRIYWILKSRYKEPCYYVSTYNWGETFMGQFCVVDSNGEFLKKKKLSGKYRKYFYTDYQKAKKRVEKILDEKIHIEGLE